MTRSGRLLEVDASRRGDAELLAEIARGDLSALGLLFDRHHARVRRVIVRTGARGDADDVLQATFLEVARIASTSQRRSHVRFMATPA